jgi:hypothetical protein
LTIPIVLDYIINGTVGGLLYVLISKWGYDHEWDIIRRLVMGAIAGYIVYIAGALISSIYGTLPSGLIAFAAGYVGLDAIEAILIRMGLLTPPKPPKQT